MRVIYISDLIKFLGRLAKKIILIIIILVLIGIFSGYHQRKEIIFLPQNVIEVSNQELPMPVPSRISAEEEGIRIDLEKVVVEKYFIIYSVIYGDQSFFGINLLITDLQKKPLIKEEPKVSIRGSSGRTYTPLISPEMKDFPPDEPLGWKMTSFVIFPYKVALEEQIEINISYRDIMFNLPLVTLWGKDQAE